MKLVTGANGFLGRAVLAALEERGIPVRAAVRTLGLNHDVAVGDIGPSTNWVSAMEGVDTIVHTAARTHVMNESALDPLSEYRKVNVEGTLNLARQAATANVRRFIFISSVKVNGEKSPPGRPFLMDDPPAPSDAYAVSKWEAEVGLARVAKDTGMEVVIIRPPLVYGPGVRANFLRMMRWVNSGMPLPLGSIHNKRSLVALDNLVDLIMVAIEHPAAANQTFFASDGEDLGTTELLQQLGTALGKPARLIPVPVTVLNFIASLLGRKHLAQRLCASLQIDISKTRALLGWEPPVSVNEALRKTTRDFRSRLCSSQHDV